MEPENKGMQLSTAELEAIVQVASEAAIEKYKNERGKEHERRRRQVLNNTKVLLKNYRRFKEMAENSVYDRNTTMNATLTELLEIMHGIDHRDDYEVVSIKNRVARTSLMLEHIDAMLEAYHRNCSRSIEGQRRYRVVKAMFLDDEQMTTGELAEIEHVTERTIFRDISIAYDELSVLFFGIDGVKHIDP